jgi:hypothetical protein
MPRRLRVALEKGVYVATDLQTGTSYIISPSGEGGSADWEPAVVCRVPQIATVSIVFGSRDGRASRLLPNYVSPARHDSEG